MGNKNNGFAFAFEFVDFIQAFGHKGGVADGQHLVDQQDVRVHVDGDGKSQSHVHTGGVGLHRVIDKIFQFGKFNDVGEFFLYFFLG